MKIKDSSLTFIHETENHVLLGKKNGELVVVDKHNNPVIVSSKNKEHKVVLVEPHPSNGLYLNEKTEIISLQEFACPNGDRLLIGYSPLTGKWYSAERKPVQVSNEIDHIKDSMVYKFKDSNGWVSHVRMVSEADLANGKYPCTACLMHRQTIQLVKLKESCPRCGGIVENHTLCTCGEIPHRVDCPMSLRSYLKRNGNAVFPDLPSPRKPFTK